MNETIVKDERLGESCSIYKHSSGLMIYICKKENFTSSYAIFGTKFGSVNTEFTTQNGETIKVPDGIAHFLEHKLFECEDGDAFSKYAETGASANAYTSFDRTCYLFECSSEFNRNLDILLGFVSSPYFTPETVQKEQGIIGQEIKMYDDSPSWVVLFNLLKIMYHNHPVKIDIAGTVESIADITDKTLYDCYNTFYNPSNMFLCIAGNVNNDDILNLVDKHLGGSISNKPSPFIAKEPTGIAEDYCEQKMAVSMPLFYMGIKDETFDSSAKAAAVNEILLNIICGKSSLLYEKMLESGLINKGFDFEHFSGPGYSALLFGGESENPIEVKNLILGEIERLKAEGIDATLFESVKRGLYGKQIRELDSAEDTVSILVDSAVCGFGPFDKIRVYETITLGDIKNRVSEVNINNTAVSVVKPNKEDNND